jgi:hypothetical protein
MRVKNVNGTSNHTCRCESWLNHWVRFNESHQSLPLYCAAQGCYWPPTVGAHVQKDEWLDQNWYIVPFCDSHNQATGQTIELKPGTSLASANVANTCGSR